MERYCMMSYQQMKLELEQPQKTQSNLQLKVESCFAIAYRYWTAIREKLCSYQFKNDEQKIGFFKVLKPKFTSEIEYYTLLYHVFYSTLPIPARPSSSGQGSAAVLKISGLSTASSYAVIKIIEAS